MKNIAFSFYRTVNPNNLQSASIDFDSYEFSYDTDSGIRDIRRSRRSDKLRIEIPGEGCDWSSDTDNIRISRKLTVKKPKAFFGWKYGVARNDAELGVAAIISSYSSSRRLVVPYEGTLVNTDSPTVMELSVVIPARTLRGSFSLDTVLYLKKTSSDEPPEYYCNDQGSKLGSLEDRIEVYIDEKTPEFPTRVHGEGRGNPLWRLSITWSNPLTDDFLKSVCLIINDDNPEYSNLKLDSEKKNKGMLSEIYSSAILQIIYAIKNDDPHIWADTIDGNPNTIREGSVSDYVYFMMSQRFDCDVSDIVTLSERIRRTVYGGLRWIGIAPVETMSRHLSNA